MDRPYNYEPIRGKLILYAKNKLLGKKSKMAAKMTAQKFDWPFMTYTQPFMNVFWLIFK